MWNWERICGSKGLVCFNNVVQDNTAPSVAAGSIFLVSSICAKDVTKSVCLLHAKFRKSLFPSATKTEYQRHLLPQAIIQQYKM